MGPGERNSDFKRSFWSFFKSRQFLFGAIKKMQSVTMREMRGVVMKEKFFGAMKEIGVVELARFL